ncbi:calcium-binding protein [Conexibacter sp. SYSU D00693]|uniref:calcium-binding protein n=1 Tax=Conexibacter sp. SYSU D00693 TaxID=2812560 RepID=UPI00196A7705|nr:calcium-binding protein [Conexibacter sp. SYSU D00693]
MIAALLGTAITAAPASAQQAPTPFNCRASAVWASVAGNDRVEPLVANGNPNTGGGRSPDFALCANADQGATSTATQLGISTDVLSARSASAVTRVEPEIALPVDQKITASATVEDLRLPLGSGTILIGVGAARSSATASCVNGQPDLQGTSQLTGITLGGQEVSLDRLIEALTTALAPLGPVVEITPNEIERQGGSLIVRALRVKVFRDVARQQGLVDLSVAESKVTATAGSCVRPVEGSDTGTDIRPCPPGSELDAERGVCIIRGAGTNGADIVIGKPYQGPSGGRVVSLSQARKLYPNSHCVKGPGPDYVVLGTNGNDKITGTNNADRILGLKGNDRLSGGRGNDCEDGGSGRDVLSGADGSDRLFGTSGNDALNGGSDNDTLSGGTGNDSINGGYGADRVNSGSGADVINVSTAGRKARVVCGSGRDKVRFNNEEKRTIRSDCEVRYQFGDRPRR